MLKRLDLRTKWHLIPLDEEGNPTFPSLDDAEKVFSREELNLLVNRQLYFQKYQRETHANKYVSKRIQKENT